MRKKYIVRLTQEERDELHQVIKKIKGSTQKVRRAHILLKADADGPCWTDKFNFFPKFIRDFFVVKIFFHKLFVNKVANLSNLCSGHPLSL